MSDDGVPDVELFCFLSPREDDSENPPVVMLLIACDAQPTKERFEARMTLYYFMF